ncbi:MAG: MATE family efflux transporter [Lachnospiraceae bacterium]|nr:MATE family efflux transporter [Lachnospiraceae bacterium]MCI9400815.1 MATE family efflux transporter [Lachnospiraceae bacterium]
MSLPMMVSMLVQALYNIVDSIFVARVSEDALTAVSLAFPIQTLLIAVGAGTGVGINALLSKSLGEKNYETANQTAMNGIFLAVLSFILFVAVGLFAVKPFYLSQVKSTDSEIYTMGISYLSIVCICSFGIYGQLIFEKLLQSTGMTFYSMLSQLAGAVTNIVLDPILIFGLLGMPKMGVTGAAVATVVGQCVGAVLGVWFNLKCNHELQLSIKGFRPNAKIIGKIYQVGVPSIIMQAIGSVMTYGMNLILIQFTSTATAIFGIYFKLQSFFFMPVIGLNNGMVPIIAYNFGAGKRSRIVKTIRYSLVYAFMLMFLGFLAFQLIPAQLLGMFEASDEMLEIGVSALRIIGVHFLIAWFCIIAGSVFQAVGNGVYSLIVSVARQLVILLPAAYILAKIGGLALVWWAFPIAELMSFAVSATFLVITWKKVISKVPEN